MKRKTRMLLCSLMYRIPGKVKKNVFLFGLKKKKRKKWMQPTKYKRRRLLFGELLWDYFVPYANLDYKADKDIDQIIADISGHAVTSSVCRRQYPPDSQKIELNFYFFNLLKILSESCKIKVMIICLYLGAWNWFS